MWADGGRPGRCWGPVLCAFRDRLLGFPGRGLVLVLEASHGTWDGGLLLAAGPAPVPGPSLDVGCFQHALAGTSGGAGLWGRPERASRQVPCPSEALFLSPPQLSMTFPPKGSEQNGTSNCRFSATLSQDAVVTPKDLHRSSPGQPEPTCSRPTLGLSLHGWGPPLGSHHLSAIALKIISGWRWGMSVLCSALWG